MRLFHSGYPWRELAFQFFTQTFFIDNPVQFNEEAFCITDNREVYSAIPANFFGVYVNLNHFCCRVKHITEHIVK